MRIQGFSAIVVSGLLGFSPLSALAKDVLIQSIPSGATVIVDGRVLGKTPLETTKKNIMPGWLSDGAITSVTMTFDLPLHESQSRTLNEFSVPKLIEVSLKKRALDEHFENYLLEVPGLESQTLVSANVRVDLSADLDGDGANLYRKGYVLIAYLGVTAEAAPMELIEERSKALGAVIVLVNSKDAGVKTEIREVTTRSSATISSSMGHGSLTSNAGQTAYSSTSGISLVPGRTSTQFVPFEQRQFRVQAAFWRKRKPNGLGAYFELIPPELRQKLKRNTGAYVVALEDESPAFFANLLAGDVVIGVNGRSVSTPADLQRDLSDFLPGLKLEILRDGRSQEIEIR